MLDVQANRSARRRRAIVLSSLAFLTFAPSADAHFVLQTPASWMSQDANGLPEKLGPCGDEGGGTASGTITAFQSGQTITVTIDEKVFHPGHYRISLSVHDRSELPDEPTVTPGLSPCGTVDIESPAVFPVLADGLFIHTEAFTAPQSADIVLPANVTCDHCTLQVIEFMSDHPLNNPGGCFYHHCADISLASVTVVDGGTHDPVDAGPAGSGGASTGSAGMAGGPAESPPVSSSSDSGSSGGCATYGSSAGGSAAFAIAAMVMLGLGRKRPSTKTGR